MKKQIVAFLILSISLSSCSNLMGVSKQTNIIQQETVEILEYTEISDNDKLVVATISLNAIRQTIGIGNTGFGVNFKYHPMKSGEFLIDYNYPVFFSDRVIEEYNFSERKIMKHEFTFNYSLPLFTEELNKTKRITALDESDVNYYIIMKTKSYRKYNLKLGFSQDYNRTYTNEYSLQLEQTNPDINISGPATAQINQWNSIINIGTSIQNCMNTNLKAVDENGKNYTGNASETTTVYFNLGVLVNSFVDNNEYRYYGNINGTPIDSSAIVSPKDFLKRQPIGFSFGYEKSSNYLIDPNQLMSYSVEVGTQPGYYNNIKTSFYAKLSVRFGFGFWKTVD